MRKYNFLFMLLFIAGCTVLGNESKDVGDGWLRSSIPADLKGIWNYSGGSTALNITSSTVTYPYPNRVWTIREVTTRDDELRVILMSESTFMAFYFKNITANSVNWCHGTSQYYMNLAKLSEKTDWVALLK